MAKVLFIIPHLSTHTSQDSIKYFVNSIAETQNQIRILTTYNPDFLVEGFHKNVEVLQPFKKWSLFEVSNIIKGAWNFKSDIVHLIYHHSITPSTTTLLAIPGLLQSLHQPLFILQLQNGVPRKLNFALKHWLQVSDVVLVSDDYSRLKVSAMVETKKSQKYFVVPMGPLTNTKKNLEEHWIPPLFKKYIYVSYPVSTLEQFKKIIQFHKDFLKSNERYGLVVNISHTLNRFLTRTQIFHFLDQQELNQQIVRTEILNESDNIQLIQSCEWFSLMNLHVGNPQISTCLQLATNFKKPVLLPKNIKAFEKSLMPFMTNTYTEEQWVSEKLFLKTPAYINEHHTPFSSSKNSDLIGNQLNRIYQHANDKI